MFFLSMKSLEPFATCMQVDLSSVKIASMFLIAVKMPNVFMFFLWIEFWKYQNHCAKNSLAIAMSCAKELPIAFRSSRRSFPMIGKLTGYLLDHFINAAKRIAILKHVEAIQTTNSSGFHYQGLMKRFLMSADPSS